MTSGKLVKDQNAFSFFSKIKINNNANGKLFQKVPRNETCHVMDFSLGSTLGISLSTVTVSNFQSGDKVISPMMTLITFVRVKMNYEIN